MTVSESFFYMWSFYREFKEKAQIPPASDNVTIFAPGAMRFQQALLKLNYKLQDEIYKV